MLDIFEFGHQLLETEDLDPVYVALYKSDKIPRKQMLRLVLAYSCFYHLGVAAKISENSGNKYWVSLYEAAKNEGNTWPRGGERRHFRGKAAMDAVSSLKSRWEHPESAIKHWFGGTPDGIPFKICAERVKKERGFGDWIAFKLADISERLFYPIDFTNCELGIYKDPRKGAALYKFGDYNHPITGQELKEVFQELVEHFKRYKAPPRYERPCGIQEVESILCKWKSYRKNHYQIGKDIKEIRHALIGWGSTANILLKNMPKEVL